MSEVAHPIRGLYLYWGTLVNLAKTDQPTEMPLSRTTHVDPLNHVLDWDTLAPPGEAMCQITLITCYAHLQGMK